MKRTWNERRSEVLANGQGNILRSFLQEPLPTFLQGASLISGFIWNNQELLRLLDPGKKGDIPANLSYGSFLNTFTRVENDGDFGEIFYYLLFYGFIEPLDKINRAGSSDKECPPQEESEALS